MIGRASGFELAISLGYDEVQLRRPAAGRLIEEEDLERNSTRVAQSEGTSGSRRCETVHSGAMSVFAPFGPSATPVPRKMN